jgi:hypothetical protein
VKKPHPDLSPPEYFTTVFISGEDMVKELLEVKRREEEEFKKKLKVANPHFYVNTRVNEGH